MDYQPKTTIITISVWLWRETTDCPISSRFAAAHAIAVQFASRCQMDIMSFAPYSLEEKGNECRATVVYVNNGRSLSDILGIMQPEINNKPQQYWMIQDLCEWQGLLDCIATARGTSEAWD